jgi:hypothetical protein
VPDPSIPPAVIALADARALARAGKDWAEADRLRAEIEAADWKVVDRGFSYARAPAHPPDVSSGGVVRYGRSASVPSRLDEPPTAPATVVLVATDWPDDLARTLTGLRGRVPAGTHVVVVADAPSATQDEARPRRGDGDERARPRFEVIRTSLATRLGGGARDGIRRAAAAVVIVPTRASNRPVTS